MITASSPSATARSLWVALCRLAPVLIAALAMALRLYRIDAQSLWFDEGWSVHLAREPLGDALPQIASEGHTHPPGYYLLLMGWVRLWGHSVAAGRALSALTGALTVYLVYLGGRTLCDRPTGLLAAGLLAVSPAHWVYSQEARMYALLSAAFAGLLPLVYRYVRAREGWRRRDWAALVGLEILACYTHLFSAFFLAGLAVWLGVALLLGPRDGRRALFPWLASQVVVGLAFLPWLGPALARAGEHTAIGALPPRPGSSSPTPGRSSWGATSPWWGGSYSLPSSRVPRYCSSGSWPCGSWWRAGGGVRRFTSWCRRACRGRWSSSSCRHAPVTTRATRSSASCPW